MQTKLSKDALSKLVLDANLRSAKAQQLHIIEISDLNRFLNKEDAETIRAEYVATGTIINQISNLRKWSSWTANQGIVDNLKVRFIPEHTFKINTEILVFNDTVVAYRLEPEPFYHEITDKGYADTVRGMFGSLWQVGDNLLMTADGSTLTKQYLPITHEYKDLPIVIYPAKDDGRTEDIFNRQDKNSLQKYAEDIIDAHEEKYNDADMLIVVVWGNEKIKHADVWKVNRNYYSDDSGFLYDVSIYKDIEKTEDMGVASGNTSIILTAEEMLLRELIVVGGVTFKEAADRTKYQARFPVGYVPEESFYLD